jgi:hypothetical protein
VNCGRREGGGRLAVCHVVVEVVKEVGPWMRNDVGMGRAELARYLRSASRDPFRWGSIR